MTETTSPSEQRALFFGDEEPEDQSSSPDFARSLAVVVGINDYRHVPRLRTAVLDAEELARILQAEYGYEVQILTQDVTLARFQALLAGLRDTVGAYDRMKRYVYGLQISRLC